MIHQCLTTFRTVSILHEPYLSVSALAELGVRRISYGSGLFAASLAGFAQSLASIREN